MSITAVRIDGRLVHGQVANLWTPSLGVTRIMVVDNQVVDKCRREGWTENGDACWD